MPAAWTSVSCASLMHRHLQAAPEPFLTAMAPSRAPLVGAGEGRFTWHGLADRWAHAGRPFGLGHALAMTAIPGGTANNDTRDAPQMAGLLRGGRGPQAAVSPAAMRATRDLLRRRMPLRRKRAALLAPVPTPQSPYNLPEIGQQSAAKAHRAGVAARWPDPAVHKSIEVDLALRDSDDHLLTALALPIVHTAQAHDAPTLARRRSLSGGQYLG